MQCGHNQLRAETNKHNGNIRFSGSLLLLTLMQSLDVSNTGRLEFALLHFKWLMLQRLYLLVGLFFFPGHRGDLSSNYKLQRYLREARPQTWLEMLCHLLCFLKEKNKIKYSASCCFEGFNIHDNSCPKYKITRNKTLMTMHPFHFVDMTAKKIADNSQRLILCRVFARFSFMGYFTWQCIKLAVIPERIKPCFCSSP